MSSAQSGDLGRVAYDAYRVQVHGIAQDGKLMHEWDSLCTNKPEVAEAWRVAAQAVVAAVAAKYLGPGGNKMGIE